MIFEKLDLLKFEIDKLKKLNKKIVWTNWCFDIIHPWHIQTFKDSKKLWDVLVVWINSDSSPYFKSKPWRPINNQQFRSEMIDCIRYVDFVYLFDDETPIVSISSLLPDILVKWWDYNVEEIVWYKEVTENWWKVLTIPIFWSYSTTAVIKKILDVYW